MTSSTKPRLGSITEASELSGVSVWTVRRWYHEGKLRGSRVGERGYLRVDLDQLAQLIQPVAVTS